MTPVEQDDDGLCPHGSPDLDCDRCMNVGTVTPPQPPTPRTLDQLWELLAADIHAGGNSVRGAIATHRPAIEAGAAGAALAAGEVARIGFPGQPFGYATGGNAPAAPAAPAIDPERLAKAMNSFETRADESVFVETNPGSHRPDCIHVGWIEHEYARLANPEKP